MTQLLRMMFVALLLALASGGLVWFGWALAQNVFVLRKLLEFRRNRVGDVEDKEEVGDSEAEAVS